LAAIGSPAERGRPLNQVVAFNVRNAGIQAEARRQRPQRGGQPGRIDAPALVTILTPRSSASPRQSSSWAGTSWRSRGRVAGAVAGQDQHRQLGEIVAGQHVERTAFEHLAHRGEAVSVETEQLPIRSTHPRLQPRWKKASVLVYFPGRVFTSWLRDVQ